MPLWLQVEGQKWRSSPLVRDSSNGAEKCGFHLGDQFLLTVKLVSKARPKRSIETGLVARAVDQFMKQSAVVVWAINEALASWNVDQFGTLPIVGAVFCRTRQLELGPIALRAHVFCAFIEAERRPLTAGTAEESSFHFRVVLR